MIEKKADYPIQGCEGCRHLQYSPINDAMCDKAHKYLWLNGYRPPSDFPRGKKFSTYKFSSQLKNPSLI